MDVNKRINWNTLNLPPTLNPSLNIPSLALPTPARAKHETPRVLLSTL